MTQSIEIMDYDDDAKGYFRKLNNQYHGIWKITWPDGKTKWEQVLHKGSVHGYNRHWNLEGKQVEEDYYWRDLLNGISRKWYDNGILKEENQWDMGTLLSEKYYDVEGNLIKKETYPERKKYEDIKDLNTISNDYKIITKYLDFD
ncbi:MAG: toxin-antitoxin system YwqK family antitoxin [Janthinobacterium lividum]